MFENHEEFYEPSEFDLKMDELKDLLKKSIKEDFLFEIERLKKENAELQEIKNNFRQIKRDYESKERQLEYERKDLERKVRRERLSSLMKDFEVVMYRAYSKSELPPKCEKCDEKRRIKYITPLGKEAYENCDCSNGNTVFYPEEYICSEFKINSDSNGMAAWYKLKPNRDYDYASFDSSTFAKVIYQDGLKFEDIDRWDTFFKTKEECQKYCDWLNSQKEEGSRE